MSKKGTDKAVPGPGGGSDGGEEEGDEKLRAESSSYDSGQAWLDDYYEGDFGGEYEGTLLSYKDYFPGSEEEEFLLEGEDEGFSDRDLRYYVRAEDEQDVEKFLYRVPSTDRRYTVEPELPFRYPQGTRRRSLFVHSSPTHFPDVSQARKSVFGSIFLHTTGQLAEDATLLKSVADSSYSMLHSLLNSYEKIISSASEPDRKNMALAYKQSLLKALEAHGISRTYSDGSVHWNIYPIAHDYLFSVQVGDHIHQTRLLTRIEERILTGSSQKSRLPYAWPDDSVWTGHWDSLGMAGVGTYTMPHGVSYNGKMKNGIFHDDNATLTYPNKFKALHCVFVRGKLMSCQFQFPDLLMHEKDNWKYCKLPDRRFWSEVRSGLKPAKIAQKTEIDPPRKIPEGFYDTNDGFYDPKSLMLVSPSGNLLRVPVCEEDNWIKKYCRKGFVEPTDFRPDLFENWFNYDQELIQKILKGQESYRAGRMTYEELQQYYADLNLLPSWSKFQKRKSPSEIALEEYLKSIPEPKPLRPPRVTRKFQGHKISSEVLTTCHDEDSRDEHPLEKAASKTFRPSKSFIRQKSGGSQIFGSGKLSKISFKFEETPAKKTSLDNMKKTQQSQVKREIPKKYLEYRPVLKPPFGATRRPTETKSGEEVRKKKKKKCLRKTMSEVSGLWDAVPSEDAGEAYDFLEGERTRKFMKQIIMEKVTEILVEERERHRKRFQWAQKLPQKSTARTGQNEKCLKLLEELFWSIPDREEYADSDPSRTCNLKKLAEDKYQTLKYWGKRIYLLDFQDKKP